MKRSIAVLPMVLCIGCGGGGGGGSVAVTPVQPATTARQIQPGDMWELTGTWRQGTVTLRFDVLPGTTQAPGGTDCLTQRLTTTIVDGDGTFQDVRDQLVSADGTLYGQVQNQVTDWVTQRQGADMPAFDVGSAAHSVLTFASGNTYDVSSRIDATERVTTAAGTFDCWKVYVSSTDTDGTTGVGNEWIAPEVGPVKMQTTYTYPNRGSVQLDVSLSQYSIH